MKIIKSHRVALFFILFLFFVINLLQSYFTLLFEDEAYYWVWSRDLALGYFDHPPLVALWIKLSSFFFQGELGLRFLSAAGFTFMLWVLWITIDHKEKWNHVFLFFILISSLALLQVFGFIITPDTPLLVFVSLFFLAYKKFLSEKNLLNTLFLGFTMAGMLYSKYHGVLVIGFVLLSNWKLLKSSRFWLAAIFGFLLFLPHLWWQYSNGFPSFMYHLKDRAKKPYHFGKTLLHLVNMIAIIGITFPLIYKALFSQKAKNDFERSLLYTIYGFFVFFFLASFSSTPQAQWLAAALIPLVLITFPYFATHKKPAKWLYIVGLAQLLIILVSRIFLAFPEVSPIVLEPHYSRHWIPELREKTKERPIVFVNSYRNAAIYSFYTGIPTHSYSVLKGRKSQYNLYDYEKNMQGKDVYGVGRLLEGQPLLVKKNNIPLYGGPIDNYTTFERVKCQIDMGIMRLTSGVQADFTFSLTNTYPKNINFEHVRFVGVFQGKKNKILAKVPLQVENLHQIRPGEELRLSASFLVPELERKEKKTFRIGLEFYDLLEGYQGNKVPVYLN